jgi:small subunit ribosomal protein S16
MLTIRFLREGKRNQAFFKIVIIDKRRAATSNKFVEEIGNFNPKTKVLNLNKERVKYWLSVGAKPSPRVFNILVQEKILEGKKIPVHKKKKREKKEENK